MAKNTYDATIECLGMLHRIVCPQCPKVYKKFEEKWCPTCTRRVGYAAALDGLSKKPWFDARSS